MKAGEIVFYCCSGKPCIGRLGYKRDKDKWIIVPLQKNKERAPRKTDKIVPASYFYKHLDIYKKI